MEEEWQIEIVKRSNRGVIFTEEGRYLVQKSYIIQDFMKEIKDHFAHKHVAKELLRIGVPNSFAKLHMPSLLKGYTDALNALQIKTVANSSDVIVRHLMDGTIDIGIVCGDYPYLGKKIHLFTEDLYIAAPQGVSIDEIEDMPLIKSFLNPMVEMIVDQWWKNQFGARAHESQYVPFIDIAIEMVEKDLGVAFLFGNDWKINVGSFFICRLIENRKNINIVYNIR